MPASSTRHRSSLLLVAVTVLCACVLAPLVGAQEGPTDPTTDSSVPSSTAPSTTAPGPPGSSPGSSTTTTLPAPLPSLPPELADDPRAPFLADPGPGDGLDVPIAQQSFDPRSVAVRPELVAAARRAVDDARGVLEGVRSELESATAQVGELTAELDRLGGRSRAAVAAVASARAALRDRAVRAYLMGDIDERLLLTNAEDVIDHGVARNYVEVVARGTQEMARRHERARAGLDREQLQLADQLAAAQVRADAAKGALGIAFADLMSKGAALQAYEAGAQAYVDGFVFPVAGDAEFIDSWGFPRMMGTPSAHWHQGTDIFASLGTPLIAVENGVLERIGVASLGGNKLWVRGDSGTEYYYAHLAGFAPGIAEGQRVRAGDLVGYVGDTGNARGTSPHLHFEIHPGGVGPVNPYPILRAAWGNRPMATTPLPIPPNSGPPGTPAGT